MSYVGGVLLLTRTMWIFFLTFRTNITESNEKQKLKNQKQPIEVDEEEEISDRRRHNQVY